MKAGRRMTGRAAEIREWILQAGGLISYEELLDRVVATYDEVDFRRSVESQAAEDIRHAVGKKDPDGIQFAKRHGAAMVVLSGPHGTAHTEEQLFEIVKSYRQRAMQARHQGWKHVRFGWSRKRLDLRSAMEPTDEEVAIATEDRSLTTQIDERAS